MELNICYQLIRMISKRAHIYDKPFEWFNTYFSLKFCVLMKFHQIEIAIHMPAWNKSCDLREKKGGEREKKCRQEYALGDAI